MKQLYQGIKGDFRLGGPIDAQLLFLDKTFLTNRTILNILPDKLLARGSTLRETPSTALPVSTFTEDDFLIAKTCEG